MSEKIEQVARALLASDKTEGHADSECTHLSYMKAAKAAIEAMREPTTAMIEAEPDGDGEFDKTNSVAHAKAFWQAMIDAALK